MNQILAQVENYMREALKNTLPEINKEDLEDGGAVFYMNGKNGTAFDWYVNDHLPSFFIFYNDKENLFTVIKVMQIRKRIIITLKQMKISS